MRAVLSFIGQETPYKGLSGGGSQTLCGDECASLVEAGPEETTDIAKLKACCPWRRSLRGGEADAAIQVFLDRHTSTFAMTKLGGV